jgi:hypothetical protein
MATGDAYNSVVDKRLHFLLAQSLVYRACNQALKLLTVHGMLWGWWEKEPADLISTYGI